MKTENKKIEGNLLAFFETGTEGVLWSVEDPLINDYTGLFVLEDGDLLTVYNPDKSHIVWSGIIQLDWKTNYTPYPDNPQYGQQAVLNYWVHGLQKDVVPEVWAKLFFNAHPAELIRNKIHS